MGSFIGDGIREEDVRLCCMAGDEEFFIVAGNCR